MRTPLSILSALASGLIFGLGLTVSGMINPQKVLGFLDLFGDWDPTLAFVMGGAILVTLPGFRLMRRRGAPVFSEVFRFPTNADIDGRLIAGSALFGVGWGLAGFCPGPALAAFGTGIDTGPVVAFLVAMVLGLVSVRFLPTLPRPRSTTAASAQDG